MQKSLFVSLFCTAISATACERRAAVTLPNPLAAMEAEARQEWASAAQDTSPAADTVYKSADDANGNPLAIAYHLPSQTAHVDWKGQALQLPLQSDGAIRTYADARYALYVGLDSIALRQKGKVVFTSTVPPHTRVAQSADGRAAEITQGAFDSRVRVVLGSDTLYLNEQAGLVKSERYHDAHHQYAILLGTHTLEKDGKVLFTGKTVHAQQSRYGYKAREGGKKVIQGVRNLLR